MRAFSIVAGLVGLIQITLAALYFVAPVWFVTWQGLTPPAADAGYPLGMLAARFLVYGVGMFAIARDPLRHVFWARGMMAIQALDFAVGLAYVAMGVVPLAHAGFPMFNAAWITVALWVTLPMALKAQRSAEQAG